MSFDPNTIPGWELLRDDGARKVAAWWFSRIGEKMEAHLKLSGHQATSWKTCLRTEIDDESGTISGEYETAYAVRMPNGSLTLGIAPTSRSASCRAKRLLRYGRCAAAALPGGQPHQAARASMPALSNNSLFSRGQ
jgi:hypothetical protein